MFSKKVATVARILQVAEVEYGRKNLVFLSATWVLFELSSETQLWDFLNSKLKPNQ